MNQLIEFFENEVVPAIKEQLESDQERWGDTWKHRPLDGQEGRIEERFADYFDQFVYSNVPVPWKKIIGNAIIAMAREAHPEWLIDEDE